MGRLLRTPVVCVAILAALSFIGWKLARPQAPALPPQTPRQETIPAGIVVTESNSPAPPAAPTARDTPGDRLLVGYGDPAQPPQNDVVLIARMIANFLILDKQATDRPLSANEEWSAALRGKRPGSGPWISDGPPVFDSQHRLIDRWGTPLHFHALGGKQWEIRSAGPDRKLWTSDDLLEKTAG